MLEINNVNNQWLETINEMLESAVIYQSQVLKDAGYDKNKSIQILNKKIEKIVNEYYKG